MTTECTLVVTLTTDARLYHKFISRGVSPLPFFHSLFYLFLIVPPCLCPRPLTQSGTRIIPVVDFKLQLQLDVVIS